MSFSSFETRLTLKIQKPYNPLIRFGFELNVQRNENPEINCLLIKRFNAVDPSTDHLSIPTFKFLFWNTVCEIHLKCKRWRLSVRNVHLKSKFLQLYISQQFQTLPQIFTTSMALIYPWDINFSANYILMFRADHEYAITFSTAMKDYLGTSVAEMEYKTYFTCRKQSQDIISRTPLSQIIAIFWMEIASSFWSPAQKSMKSVANRFESLLSLLCS